MLSLKTQLEVEQDFYMAVKQTTLKNIINGGFYKHGYRPDNSKLEDCIVKITTLDNRELQNGVVTIVIYCPMIDGLGNGKMVADKNRLIVLENACKPICSELTNLMEDYNGIKLNTSIGSYLDTDIEQTFVSVKIDFQYLNKEV